MSNLLAINGGPALRTDPWPTWPFFSQDEIDSVSEVLRSGKVNYWTGPLQTINEKKVRGKCGEFEELFSHYLKVEHAICVANGTLALELCLYAFNLKEGDEVIVPSRTFIATATSCTAQKLTPVFADIDPNTQCLSLDAIKDCYTNKTKAIICVHLSGHACEMDEIMAYAKEKNLRVIEDCAQSLGSSYKGKKLGTFGDMAAFSFCQDKIMTTGGEGGMVVTNDPDLYLKSWQYKDHGKNFHFFNTQTNHKLLAPQEKEKGMYSSIGTNFRMTEMQAAIGIKQLEKLPIWLKKRKHLASILTNELAKQKGLKIIEVPAHIDHAYYKYNIFLEKKDIKPEWDFKKIAEAIRAEGVGCELGSTWAIGREHGWSEVLSSSNKSIQKEKHLRNDLKVGESILTFQVHPTLEDQDIYDVVKVVKKVFAHCLKE